MKIYNIYIILLVFCSFIYAEIEPGIYFSRKGDDGFWSVHFFRFSDKSTTCVLPAESCDYGTPACSPDGKFLAFTTNKRGRYDLVYLELNAKNNWVYTTNEANNSHPTWSADSKRIAYVSTRNHKTQIFVHDITTKEEFCITSSFAIAGQPSWHPQQNKIAFCGNRDIAAYDGRNDIFIYDLMTKTYTKVTPGDDSIKESHPVWDFDGALLFDQANIEYIGGMPVAKDSFIVKYEKQQIVSVAKGKKFYSYPATLPHTKNIVFLRHEADFRFSIVYYENKRFITELTFGYTDRTPRFGHYLTK